MEERGTTYWKYQFTWRNVPCEARDGRIFINNRRVEELTDVNQSSQAGDLFFVDGRDVTDICVRYLPKPDIDKEDREIKSLKERMVTITGESLAGESRTKARAPLDADLEAKKEGEPKRAMFGLRPRRGRLSMRQGKTA